MELTAKMVRAIMLMSKSKFTYKTKDGIIISIQDGGYRVNDNGRYASLSYAKEGVNIPMRSVELLKEAFQCWLDEIGMEE